MLVKPKVISCLSGGLGNQMFQYAAARCFALHNSCELVVDDWSGFVRDYQYRRVFELGSMPIKASIAKPMQRLPIWLWRWASQRSQGMPKLLESRWYGDFLIETKLLFLQQFYQIIPQRNTWVVGYWQSPKYFHGYEGVLRSELMPPTPKHSNYRALGEEILRTESVAIGLRLYEESNNPSAHALGAQVKSIAEVRDAVSRLCIQHPYARCYVFCTHRSSMLSEIGLPDNAVFVTGDDGYSGSLETLWLLTCCQHHIFTNSSYYWWGAWLSATIRGEEGQRVLAADNFINRDGLCPEWERF